MKPRTKLWRNLGKPARMVGCALLALALWLPVDDAHGHFLELIPSSPYVTDPAQSEISFDIAFTHPWAGGPMMDMGKPVQFGVQVGGAKADLIDRLTPAGNTNPKAWRATYKAMQPGDHLFYLEPKPYWEPAEAKSIIHYTKVVVEAFGAQEGWDDMIGFPVEIQPLTRPYGLWTGNAFRGLVLHNGKPVAFGEVEVEYRAAGTLKEPHASFETQVIKTDGQGVFSYVMPKTGWWGFAALVDGEPAVNAEGNMADVELGGLLWVQTQSMPDR